MEPRSSGSDEPQTQARVDSELEVEPKFVALEELPSEVADLIFVWVQQWLAALDRARVPGVLRPYVGFRSGSKDSRVRAAVVAALASGTELPWDVGQWVTENSRLATDPERPEVGPVALAWLRRDFSELVRSLIQLAQVERVAIATSEGTPVAGDTGRQTASDGSGIEPAVVSQLETELARLRGELARVTESKRNRDREQQRRIEQLTKDVKSAERRAEAAERQVAQADDERRSVRQQAKKRESDLAARLRSTEGELARARDDRSLQRRSSRHLERVSMARLHVLTQTATAAMAGLAEELSLPSDDSPTDVARSRPSSENPLPRRLGGNQLQEWLQAPGIHLLLDGYNITKSAVPELPLAQQRELLVNRMAALSARMEGEITVVFDAQHVNAVMPSSSRKGVSVIFTDEGELADDVLVELVGLEPPGRPVLVVTSDQEVVVGVTRLGARAVPSQDFWEWLDRG